MPANQEILKALAFRPAPPARRLQQQQQQQAAVVANAEGNSEHQGAPWDRSNPPQPQWNGSMGPSQPQVLGQAVPTPPHTPRDVMEAQKQPHFSCLPAQALQVSEIPRNIQVNNVSYPAAEIRMMAKALKEARENKEFPNTISNPFDCKIIVSDYQLLSQLRALRVDIDVPASNAYKQLLVEVARKIQSRDDAIREMEREVELGRRMTTYMNTVNMEGAMYAQAQLRAHAAEERGGNLNDNICSTIEGAVEENLANALAPLRLNCSTLGNQVGQHLQLTQSLNAQVDTLKSLLQPQMDGIQGTSDSLALTTIVNNLSQLTRNLPEAINQVVTQAVQQQTRAAHTAIKDAMEAQKQMLLSFQEEQREVKAASREIITKDLIDAMVASFTERSMDFQATSQQREDAASPKRKFGEAFKTVFKGKKRSARRGNPQ